MVPGLPLFVYDQIWLLVAVIALLPAVFVAICRQALDRFSRKALLDATPPERLEIVEGFASQKDDYERSLKGVDFLLRLVLVLCLSWGRLRWLADNAPSTLGEASGGIALLDHVLQPWHMSIVAVEVLVVVAVFLRLIPSIVARARAEAFLLRFFPVVDRVHRAHAPARDLLERIAGSLARILGGRKERTSADIAEEEILSAVEEGEREGLLESRDIDMIESIIDFGKAQVSEVMTPRTDMVCLDLDAPVKDSLEEVIQCGHSRIPVYRGTRDNITGLLYVKDLLKYLYAHEEIDLESIARKPHFVPLSKGIGELLQEFKKHRRHIAMVLDEHGGIAGLITIEDILEEIVGEITDEYEEEESAPIQRLSSELVAVDAAVHIDDLNEELDVQIPEDESYDTVGGFLFATMGRLPAEGDFFDVEGLRFEVTEADDRRVHRLKIHLPDESMSSNGASLSAARKGDGADSGRQRER